jgi:serine/threonine protein kinase
VQDLKTELARFSSGLIDADELAQSFRNFALANPAQRSEALAWIESSVAAGRLSPVVVPRLQEALSPPPPPPPPTPPPAPSAVAPEGVTRLRATSASDAMPEVAAAEVTIGTVLKNRFVLVAELGRGGMGSVFKARDRLKEEARDRNPYVALKVLSEDFKRHPDSFIALQREAKRAQTLAHPNVSTVYDFDRDGPHVYITMEFLDGRTLDQVIAAEGHAGLPFEKVWPMVSSMASALQYGHQKGIVHSDFKPGNVFICNDGAVKLLDFGISRPMPLAGADSADTEFDPGKRLGGLTPAYASLEMWLGQPPDARDDIYALGCVTYELLTGRHPFGHANAKQAFESGMTPRRIEGLTRRQWDGLRRTMQFSRNERTASVAAFLAELAPRGMLKRHSRSIVAGTTVVVVAAVVLGARFYRSYVEDRMLEEMPLSLDSQGDSGAATTPQAPAAPLTDADRTSIAGNLQLASEFLKEAPPPSNSPDYADELSYVLTEGPNNVNDILVGVLLRDPRNGDALKMRAEIVQRYADAARGAYERRDYRNAAELARRALKIAPKNRDLFRLQRDICEADAALCSR